MNSNDKTPREPQTGSPSTIKSEREGREASAGQQQAKQEPGSSSQGKGGVHAGGARPSDGSPSRR